MQTTSCGNSQDLQLRVQGPAVDRNATHIAIGSNHSLTKRYAKNNDTRQQVLKCAKSLALYCDSAHGWIGDGFLS